MSWLLPDCQQHRIYCSHLPLPKKAVPKERRLSPFATLPPDPLRRLRHSARRLALQIWASAAFGPCRGPRLASGSSSLLWLPDQATGNNVCVLQCSTGEQEAREVGLFLFHPVAFRLSPT